LSLFCPGSSWATSDRSARAARTLRSAGLLAIACLLLGFGAPAASASDPTLAQAEQPQSAGPLSGSQLSDTPAESTPSPTPSDPPPLTDPAQPGDSSAAQPSNTAATAEQPNDQNAAAEAKPGGPEGSEASTQRAAGSGDNLTLTISETFRIQANGGAGPGDPSSSTEIADLVAITPASGGTAGGGVETGGTPLLPAGSLGCGLVCYGHSGGSFGTDLSTGLGQHGGMHNTLSQASELPPLSIPGAPGSPRGPFFNLLGGAGGGAMGFMLLSLVAVLASALLRRPDWTTAFRLPAAMWRPLVYVPPLESPG
jgi:hypothetical protein